VPWKIRCEVQADRNCRLVFERKSSSSALTVEARPKTNGSLFRGFQLKRYTVKNSSRFVWTNIITPNSLETFTKNA